MAVTLLGAQSSRAGWGLEGYSLASDIANPEPASVSSIPMILFVFLGDLKIILQTQLPLNQIVTHQLL